MMLNIISVLILYCSFYLSFTILGLGITRVVFHSRIYLASLLSPIFGLTLFCLISTALMQHMPGATAGPTGLLLSFLFSMILYFTSPRQQKTTFSTLVHYQWPAFLSGLIFLTPLLIAGDLGIFALNGADFGSYAGWGHYFQDYTLKDKVPHTEGINSTLKAFSQLQVELTRPDGRWRIGNVSLFAALRSLLTAAWWPTLYTISIAFLIAQFTVAVQLFARIVLFQTLKNTVRLGLLSIFLTTVVWLAASHYVPNVMGLTYTLLIISMFLLISRFHLRFILGGSILIGGLILLYPESFAFFPFLLFAQLLFRDPFLKRPLSISLLKSRTLLAGFALMISMGLAILWTYESFFYCLRHFSSIVGYNRPGDFVGIHLWAYPSQGMGFIDYNAVLRGGKDKWLKLILIINYFAAFALLVYGATFQAKENRERLRKRAYLTLMGCVIIFVMPICLYFAREQYLVAWRALLTISPYTWLLICIAGLTALPLVHQASSVKKARWVVLCFAILLVTDLSFRFLMIKNITYGATHAAIFGEAFQKTTALLQARRQSYDIAFIDYEGTGTIQGGWEFYSQNLSYLFPQHGIGHNEYEVSALRNRRVVILSDAYKKVHSLKGFEQSSFSFQGRTVSFADNNNFLQPYSSTWVYIKEGPVLALPGLPGKLLLWLNKKSRACLNLSVKSSRTDAFLRISFNESNPISLTLDQVNSRKICHEFKQGLNTIRLDPVFLDEKTLHAQQQFIQAIRTIPGEKRTEEQHALLKIYSQFHPINPLSSPSPAEWNTHWNLIIPQDTFPFNPHLIFKKIEVEKA